MPNPIKFSTGSESLALKKGNFFIGTGDVGKGPTSTTGYFNGITPPSGGYTIYLNKESEGPSIYSPANDAQLIVLTNLIAGQSYTTANECLDYFAGQTDKLCVNRDYEAIVTDGLVLNSDAGFTPSYPKSGTNWIDISLNSFSGVLNNGPEFNSDGGGSVVFDGTNDFTRFSSFSQINTTAWTCHVFTKSLSPANEGYIVGWRSSSIMTIGTWAGSWISHCSTTLDWITGPSVLNNTWTCITASYLDGTQTLYRNGTLYGSKSANFSSPNSYLDLGAINGSYNFNGYLGICLFYNRALTASEVLQNYNAQKGRFGL